VENRRRVITLGEGITVQTEYSFGCHTVMVSVDWTHKDKDQAFKTDLQGQEHDLQPKKGIQHRL